MHKADAHESAAKPKRNLRTPARETPEITQLPVADAALPASPAPPAATIDLPDFHFHLDNPRVVKGAAAEPVIDRLTLEGWAFSRSGIARIDVRLNDIPLGEAQYGLPRPDVGNAYPDWHRAPHSGFAFQIPPEALRRGQHLVRLTLRDRNGNEIVERFRIDVRTASTADDLTAIHQSSPASTSRFEQILPTILPPLVEQVYQTVLCRQADASGLGHYVDLLATGKITLRRLVDVMYESEEFATIVEPAAERVREAYLLLFEREPTPAESAAHVEAFRASCDSHEEALALLQPGGAARARFGLRPIKIEMDITNQCNIRCVMCPFSGPAVGGRKRKDLDLATFRRWADQMFSWAAQIGLMFGTEPTLNKNLVEFVRIAKEYRVPNVYFSTNAMKLTPTLAADLIEAGLDEVNVSLDAGTKDTFQRIRRGAKWDTVIANLRSLRDQKAARQQSTPRLHMSFVMMRSNIRELPQFVALAAELGAVVIYCTHLVAYDGLEMAAESLGTNLGDYEPYIDTAQMLAAQHNIHIVLPRIRQIRLDLTLPDWPPPEPHPNHLAHLEQVREAHGLPKRFARDEANSCCPFPWHFMAIEPDGAVSPCGWWHSGPTMGNLHTQSFQEIWSGEPMRLLRSQLVYRHLGPNCSRCPAAGAGSSDSPQSFQPR